MVILPAGNMTGECLLYIVDDLQREADETMTVKILTVTVTPPGAAATVVLGVDVSTVITITDDDSTYNCSVRRKAWIAEERSFSGR